VSAALDARGLKRVCVGCGIRFYDLNKRPINCPNCQAEFSGEIKLKSRRGRAAIDAAEAEKAALKAKAVPVANDDQNSDVEARDEDVVSLEDVEALENAGADDDADEIEVEDDDIGSLEEIEEDASIDVPVDKKKE
jgi:uncharacterized protein (TIGR02300 family)